MKKLFVLILLPVMASLAGATLIMVAPDEVNPGEVFYVTVRGLATDVSHPAPSGTQVNGAVQTPDIEADSFVLNDGVGGPVADGSITDNFTDYGSYDYIIASPGGSSGITADGTANDPWVTIIFTAGAGGDEYTFTRLDNSFIETANQITTTVLPEPMTMALLGFGGLFLRRRK